MKYCVDKEHRHIFQKDLFIEFFDLVPNPDKLQEEIEQRTADRLGRSTRSLSHVSGREKFLKSRSLLPDGSLLKKTATQKKYAEILSELTMQKQVRFGFAQCLFGGEGQPSPFSLQKTCVSPVIGAALLTLTPRDDDEQPSLFSTEKGSAVFIEPHKNIDFASLEHSPFACYLLLVYVSANAVYRERSQDPLSNFLLSAGYGYGDRLEHPNHPLLIR